MITFLKAHKRLTVIARSWAAFLACWLIPNWQEGPLYFLSFSALFVMLIGSQTSWLSRVLDLSERLIPGKPRHSTTSAPCRTWPRYHQVPDGPASDVACRSVSPGSDPMIFAAQLVGSPTAPGTSGTGATLPVQHGERRPPVRASPS